MIPVFNYLTSVADVLGILYAKCYSLELVRHEPCGSLFKSIVLLCCDGICFLNIVLLLDLNSKNFSA